MFYVLLCATLFHSSFAIMSMGKREPVGSLCLSSWCLVIVVWLFLAMSRVYLDGEERAVLLCLICLPGVVILERLFLALPRGAMGFSAVCDCGIS